MRAILFLEDKVLIKYRVDVLEKLQSFPPEQRKTQFSSVFLFYSHTTSTLTI